MRSVGRDAITATLPSEEYRNITRRVSAAARGAMVAEKILPLRQLEGGENAIGWTQDRTFKLDVSPGSTAWGVRLGRQEEMIALVSNDVNLMFAYTGFDITPEMMAATRLHTGKSIDLRTIASLAIDLAEDVETAMWQGKDAPVAFTGIDEGATDGGASAGAWSTRANIITDVTTLVDYVRDTGAWTGPRFLVVTSPLMTDLLVIENDYTDRVVLETIQRLFPLGVVEVKTTFLESTETALCGVPAAGGSPESELPNFEIVRAAPITTWLAPDEFGKGLKGLIFAKMAPKIHQSSALYEIDNITA